MNVIRIRVRITMTALSLNGEANRVLISVTRVKFLTGYDKTLMATGQEAQLSQTERVTTL